MSSRAVLICTGLPPRLTPTRPIPAGFTLTESTAARTFTLARYRAHGPHRVTPAMLAALAFSEGEVGLLIE